MTGRMRDTREIVSANDSCWSARGGRGRGRIRSAGKNRLFQGYLLSLPQYDGRLMMMKIPGQIADTVYGQQHVLAAHFLQHGRQ